MRFKKTLLIGVGSILMFTMGGVGPAQADNGPHKSSAAAAGSKLNAVGAIGTTGRCASCHRAHTAKAEYLLKQAQPQLCYSCHDGSNASTNVIDGNDGSIGLRGGGFRNAQIASGLATKDMGALNVANGRIATLNQTIPVFGTSVNGVIANPLVVGTPSATTGNVTSKHLIDGNTPGTAWGNGDISATQNLGKSITLECGSCHDPHGNGNYRALRPIPTDANNVVTAAIPAVGTVGQPGYVAAVPAVMSIAAAGVVIPDAVAKNYTTTNYWLSGDINVAVNSTPFTDDATHPLVLTGGAGVQTDGYIQNIASWCTTCHTRYLAGSESYKTASGDATFMFRHRSDKNEKAGTANCITCHVSHGSNATVGLSYGNGGLNPGDTNAAAGDSRLLRVDNRGTCSMCHNV